MAENSAMGPVRIETGGSKREDLLTKLEIIEKEVSIMEMELNRFLGRVVEGEECKEKEPGFSSPVARAHVMCDGIIGNIKDIRNTLYNVVYLPIKATKDIILKREKSRESKGIYTGIVCDVCGFQTKGDRKAEHVHEAHPEYAFHVEQRGTSRGCVTYVCDTCKITVGGVKGLINHYRERHPEKVRP